MSCLWDSPRCTPDDEEHGEHYYTYLETKLVRRPSRAFLIDLTPKITSFYPLCLSRSKHCAGGENPSSNAPRSIPPLTVSLHSSVTGPLRLGLRSVLRTLAPLAPSTLFFGHTAISLSPRVCWRHPPPRLWHSGGFRQRNLWFLRESPILNNSPATQLPINPSQSPAEVTSRHHLKRRY